MLPHTVTLHRIVARTSWRAGKASAPTTSRRSKTPRAGGRSCASPRPETRRRRRPAWWSSERSWARRSTSCWIVATRGLAPDSPLARRPIPRPVLLLSIGLEVSGDDSQSPGAPFRSIPWSAARNLSNLSTSALSRGARARARAAPVVDPRVHPGVKLFFLERRRERPRS